MVSVKKVLFVSLILVLIAACNVSRHTQIEEKKHSTNDKKEKKQEAEDIHIVKGDTTIKPPKNLPDAGKDSIQPETKKVKPTKELIHVALVVPLDGKYQTSRFVDFINGMRQSDANTHSGKPLIKINIVNIAQENDSGTLDQIPAIRQADILVGGFITSQVKALSKIASSRKIPYISPWNSSENIVSANSYYIQLKPSLHSYCSTIAQYIADNIRPEKVFLLFKSKEDRDYTTLPYFTTYFSIKHQDYQVIITGEDAAWQEKIPTEIKSVVIIPNWSDKTYILSSLREIRKLQIDDNITVTGMPQWTDFDNVPFDLYESLHLILPVSNYIDFTDNFVKRFKQNYFDKYNGIPSADSYYGADVMQIIRKVGLLLSQNNTFTGDWASGKYFSFYEIQPFIQQTSDDKLHDPEYYSNIYISLMQFKGGKFVPLF